MDTAIRNALVIAGIMYYFTRDPTNAAIMGAASYALNSFV